ncbi:MAG: M23 family metallopeptidase [Rhodothermales bacterium]
MPRFFPTLLALLLLVTAGCELEHADDRSPSDTVATRPDTTGLALALAETRRAQIGPAREPLDLRFPTGNDALFRDKSAFYAALDLDEIPGLREYGWEGGQYGYVRNPAKGSRGMIFARPHEGLDIKPLYFDARGEPADTVRAISDGRVVYANRGRSNSSYGQYVVVEHTWDGAPVYSLYAHLERVDVSPADSVAAGAPLGRLGYTGRGTARHRAHVHLEVNLLLNAHFQPFFNAFYGSRNTHGIYFGRNLAGLDVEALYRVHGLNPEFSFLEFVRSRPLAYRIAIPGEYPLDLLARYPWLTEGSAEPDSSGAWVVGFTQEGVPVEVSRQKEAVDAPEVVWVADRIERGRLGTNGILARGDSTYHLTRDGKAAAALLATSERGVPPWF